MRRYLASPGSSLAHLGNLELRRVRWSRVLVLLFPLLVACSDPPDSPEQRISELIRRGEQAAEARERDFFDDVISGQYSDAEGRSRRDILRLLTGYFLRNRSVYLLVRIDEIRIQGDQRGQAVLYAGMAGSPVEGFEQLFALRASVYRIGLDFTLGDEIKVVAAGWRRVSPEEAIP